jgi:hypothetical protein
LTKSTDRSSWDITDDWNSLSETCPRIIQDIDPLKIQDTFQVSQKSTNCVDDAIEAIHFPIVEIGDPALYDVDDLSLRSVHEKNLEEIIAEEIALLIRCNQDPEQLLYQEGRAIRPLRDEDRYDISQLVQTCDVQPSIWRPTPFLINAVSKIFSMYSTADGLAAKGVAEWMTVGTGKAIGQHDMRVSLLISKYSSYGTGMLSESQLLQIYVDAIKSIINEQHENQHELKLADKAFAKIWRELANHGIDSPNVIKHREMQKAYEITHKLSDSQANIMVDECEILHWSDDSDRTRGVSKGGTKNSSEKGSHMSVELCTDKSTPRRIRDGQFGTTSV